MKDDAVIKDNEAVYLINEQTYMQRTPKSSALRKSSLTQIPSMSDGAVIMKSAMVRKC